jgi:hypothetical protein
MSSGTCRARRPPAMPTAPTWSWSPSTPPAWTRSSLISCGKTPASSGRDRCHTSPKLSADPATGHPRLRAVDGAWPWRRRRSGRPRGNTSPAIPSGSAQFLSCPAEAESRATANASSSLSGRTFTMWPIVPGGGADRLMPSRTLQGPGGPAAQPARRPRACICSVLSCARWMAMPTSPITSEILVTAWRTRGWRSGTRSRRCA